MAESEDNSNNSVANTRAQRINERFVIHVMVGRVVQEPVTNPRYSGPRINGDVGNTVSDVAMESRRKGVPRRRVPVIDALRSFRSAARSGSAR